MDNRRLLPIMALIVSAIIFVGALVFALRPASPPPAAAPPVAVVPGTIVAAGQNPVTRPTVSPTTAPSAEPSAEPTHAPSPSARASAAVASATRTVPPTGVPVASGPTPTSASAGALPPGITPAAPPPASAPPSSAAPASAPSAPPVAAVPPTPTPAPPPPAVAPTTAPRPPAQPAPQPTPTATRPPAAAAPPPVTSGPPPANVGVPVRVLIPSLGVDASIEHVGIDAEGNMATPEDPWNTAWYAPGARPGAHGNAAIAGHVDYAGIGPVVFWDLTKLAVGAEVLVVTDSGQTLRFTVRGSKYYRPETAPLEEIFGATDHVNLNLITCGGTFNPATRQYDQRYIVFTTYAGR